MTLHAGTVLLSHMAWSLLMVSPLPFLNVSLAKNTYYQLKNKGLDIRIDQIKANQCCTWTRWCRAAGEKIKNKNCHKITFSQLQVQGILCFLEHHVDKDVILLQYVSSTMHLFLC